MTVDAKSSREPLVELRQTSVSYGPIQALDQVNLRVSAGTVVGVVGENGAGKSTLGKVISGVVTPDSGEIRVDGAVVEIGSPRDALRLGITIIAQEISLVPEATVIDNIFLGRESRRFGLVTRKAIARRFEELTGRTGLVVPAEARVGTLRLADQQKIEVLRALARNARVIVMDEPTAALSRDDADQLLTTIEQLKRIGTAVVYVSHFLEEVLAVADEITVMKDGAVVRSGEACAETPHTLVRGMLGRSLEVTFPEKRPLQAGAPIALSVRDLGRKGVVDPASFELHRGEILGIAGLVGSGRSELARLVFGADKPDSGSVSVLGNRLSTGAPRAAIGAGIAMIPESRKTQGLMLGRPLRENVSLPHLNGVSRAGLVGGEVERVAVRRALDEAGVDSTRQEAPCEQFSGGNQQKSLFAKWLLNRPHVLIADEPTRGVDVGAKLSIYQLIHDLAQRGLAVLIISSELEELFGLAHRILVMRRGRLVGEFPADRSSERSVLEAAFGTSELVGLSS